MRERIHLILGAFATLLQKASASPLSLEQKLEILARCGLKLEAPFTVNDLLESWKREEFEKRGFDLVLVGLGMTVFAQHDVGHQLKGRSEDAQGLPRQGSGAVDSCLAEAVFGAPADVPWQVAAELDAGQMAWRRTEGEAEDPALFAIASWQIELRKRMLASRGREQGRWARLLELSYDTLGYLEQNVSPRLALETFLLECRKAS